MNETLTVLEKNLTEEKKTDVEAVAVQQPMAVQTPASPQAIPAIVEAAKEAAPIVLPQVPPVSAQPLGEKK